MAQQIDIFEDNDLTQPWYVLINGTEVHRANTYAKCEGYINWHSKNGTLPVVEVEKIDDTIEYSHVGEESKDVYVYRVSGVMIGYVAIAHVDALWFNGDGCKYDSWEQAGRALLKRIRHDWKRLAGVL